MTVTFLAWLGRYLCAEVDGTVIGNRAVALEYETWTVERQPDGTIALRSHHGRYLCAELDGSVIANRDAVSEWERWTVLPTGGGKIALRSHHGKFLTVQDDYTVRADRTDLGPWEQFTPSTSLSGEVPPPLGDQIIRPVQGYVRTQGGRWADDSGLRSFRIASWFSALRSYIDHPEAAKAQIRRAAERWHGIRVLWHVWTGNGYAPGYEVDPRRPGYDEAFRNFLRDCAAVGLRVSLTTGDMQDLVPEGQEEDHWHEHIAALAASVDQTTVSWWGVWNEGWQNTAPSRATPQVASRISGKIQRLYPWGAHGLSDPQAQEEPEALSSWSRHPANCTLIHGSRDWPRCMNRAFNAVYEGRGWLLNQDEPTGLGPDVYAPLSNSRQLFGLYTLILITGQMLTYFGGHALKTWTPANGLESDWGFTELPVVWRAMQIPENIRTWEKVPGHKAHAAIYPETFEDPSGIGPHRCDGAQSDSRALYVVSGGRGAWRLRARWDGTLRLWTERGVRLERRVSAGERFFDGPPEDALVVDLSR